MFPFSVEWTNPVVEGLAVAIYLALALIVTADVLLKKSDVRGALGWIGAVWLAPIFGSLLYYLFGINRVTRRALKMSELRDRQASLPGNAEPDASPHIRLLSQAGERVTESPLTAGNDLEILQGGDAAYPQMLRAINQARHCVAICSYIFRDDEAGGEFIAALIAAHRRGVQVRVLLDSVGTGYLWSGAYERLRAGGVPVARFLHTWLPWRMPFLNMRNHRKLLIADGETAFLGGINIGRENSSRLSGARAIHDVHFRVTGPITRVIMDAFARDWSFTTNEDLDARCWWPELKPTGEIFARGLRGGPDADLYNIELILGAALSVAQKRVRIVTPYFLPDQRLQFAIAQAGLRGVEVQIVLPSRSDQTIMDWSMRGHLRFFRHVLVKFIASPPPFDHAKLCTVDGEWSLIGSSNWDARSFRLNFEFDLELTGRGVTAAIDALIDARIARGHALDPDCFAREPVWKRLRNAAARLLMPYL
jgi:cardiolipin synthase